MTIHKSAEDYLEMILMIREQKGYVRRFRSTEDERVLLVSITQEGKALRDKAAAVPMQVGACIHLTQEEAMTLHRLLYKLLAEME